MGENSTLLTLLALALLLQKVVAAVTLKRVCTASGLPDTLLGAAVGLELWHVWTRKYRRIKRDCKGVLLPKTARIL